MKKLLSCLLVIALFLGLGLTGGWNGQALAEPSESIVGLWVGSVDMHDFLAEEDPDIGPYLGSVPVSISLDMREDGTYTMILDAAPALTAMKPAMYAYIEDLCQQNGITVAQLEEAYGQSLEDVIDDALAEMDMSELNQNLEGTYEVSGEKVIWDKGANQTEGVYTGDSLAFTVENFGEVLLKRCGIVGTWTGCVKLVDVLGDDQEELAEYFGDLNMDLILELRSDNSFILALDAASMLPGMKVAMMSYMEALMKENGISAEDLEKATGQTLDELVNEAIAEMDMDELNESLTGTYTEKDGQITLKSNDGEDKGSWSGNSLTIEVENMGKLEFIRVSSEDILAKSEGVMSYEEFDAAELDSPVVIEAYVQDHQSWWDNKITAYAQDADGAYFLYNMACSEEDAAKLVPGQKIRVSGYKAEWSGEIEIVDASFEFVNGSYIFRPTDVTSLLGKNELIGHQNQKVLLRGMTVEPYDDSGAAFAYKDPDGKTDDLYFKVSKDGQTYEFCVEYYLRGNDTEVYKAVEALQVGDVVDLEGFLYWYEGPNLHTTAVIFR